MPSDVLRRNNVRVSGRGTQPMLFAHGFGCDQNVWRLATPAFEDDYRTVPFDCVGSGPSDLRAYDPDRLERLVVIGPSPCYVDEEGYVGGSDREGIEGLLDTMDKNYIGWAQGLAPVAMGNAERPALAAELEARFCSTDPTVARRFAEATFLADNRAPLPHVPVPSHVLPCADDAIAREAVGRYVHAHRPGRTLRMLDATGHCPHLSHPEETAAAIRACLAEPAAPAG